MLDAEDGVGVGMAEQVKAGDLVAGVLQVAPDLKPAPCSVPYPMHQHKVLRPAHRSNSSLDPSQDQDQFNSFSDTAPYASNDASLFDLAYSFVCRKPSKWLAITMRMGFECPIISMPDGFSWQPAAGCIWLRIERCRG